MGEDSTESGMGMASLSRTIQHDVAEKLRADGWFAERRCVIIEQNEQRLSYLIRQKVGELVGPVVVVAVDAMRNNFPAVEVDVTVNVTEVVVLNREQGVFASAIEVAEAAVAALDGDELHWQEMRHETPGDGVLTCSVRFSGMFSRRVAAGDGDGECDDEI